MPVPFKITGNANIYKETIMALSLKKSDRFNKRQGPLLLIVMDGVGINKPYEGNAVYVAKTPTLDKYIGSQWYTELQAHGKAVGLPSDDDMGNSEVGHNALGAGRIFSQGAKLVNESIQSGAMFQSETWNKIIDRVKGKKTTLHFIGLFSDGNVHSHIRHLKAMIEHAASRDVQSICIHTLLDGRDVGERSALTYIDDFEKFLAGFSGKDYRIASGGGRMITTMDRYNADWSVVERGWKAHVLGEARKFKSAHEAVQTYYSEDPKMTDQYMESFVIADDKGQPVGTINDGDSVIFFNFRGDRAIEITIAFEAKDFDKFDRKRVPDALYAGMMQYDGDLKLPTHYLVNPPTIDRTMGEFLCGSGIRSFAISETQKYGHVTYFWNGNKSGYIDEKLETYVEIPSDKIQFDQKPQMKVREITDKVKEMLESGKYDFGRLNFANGDMVGHTGNMDAAVAAVEAVDTCVGELIDLVKSMNGVVLITADHGNCDEMFTMKGDKKVVNTAHTLNPVPFIMIDPLYNAEYQLRKIEKPGLANVAATVFNFLGFEKPEDYMDSLIEWK